MQGADGQQGFDALPARLADADEDAGGEGNPGLAGVRQGLQPHRRHLVRRAVVGHALGAEPLRGGFQHDAHGGRKRPRQRQFLRPHGAGVQVGQQAGLLEDGRGGPVQIFQGRCKAKLRQPLPGRLVAQFGLFAQSEQGLLAAHRRAVAGNLQHFVQRHVGRLDAARNLGEGAVVADVPAQVRQGNEHLARVGDDVAKALVAQFGGDGG